MYVGSSVFEISPIVSHGNEIFYVNFCDEIYGIELVRIKTANDGVVLKLDFESENSDTMIRYVDLYSVSAEYWEIVYISQIVGVEFYIIYVLYATTMADNL